MNGSMLCDYFFSLRFEEDNFEEADVKPTSNPQVYSVRI